MISIQRNSKIILFMEYIYICMYVSFVAVAVFIFITNDFIAWNTNENVFALNKIRVGGHNVKYNPG